MFIAILTLLSALSISGVAIFYSVIGLATIFPGAFVPVVIMGGVLEVGKLITPRGCTGTGSSRLSC